VIPVDSQYNSRRQPETFLGPLQISFASFVSSSCMSSSCVSEPDGRLSRRKIKYKRSRASDELLHAAEHTRHCRTCIMLSVHCCFCCHDRAFVQECKRWQAAPISARSAVSVLAAQSSDGEFEGRRAARDAQSTHASAHSRLHPARLQPAFDRGPNSARPASPPV
jgi:hypothetical protein